MRVVERGAAVGVDAADGAGDGADVFGERLHHVDAVVERDDRGAVARAERGGEAGRRLADEPELAFHAGAGVDQEREVERHVAGLEIREVLDHAVFIDREVVALEVADDLVRRVGDGDGQRHDVDAGLKALPAPERHARRRLRGDAPARTRTVLKTAAARAGWARTKPWRSTRRRWPGTSTTYDGT